MTTTVAPHAIAPVTPLRTAADQVDRAAQFLREHDAREVIEGAQDFARRQPAVVIGAGLAVGLLVGRALKSANGTSRAAYRGTGQWTGDTRYGAAGSYAGGSYGERWPCPTGLRARHPSSSRRSC